MSNFGTTNQLEYATKLAGRAGYATLEAAIEACTGRIALNLAVTPYTKDDATKIITWLEKRLGVPPKAAPSGGDGAKSGSSGANGTHRDTSASGNGSGAGDGDKPKARFLTARHLRLIATHQEQAPATLDDDARWVLSRLQRLDAIEAFVRRGLPDQKLAVNGSEPIKVAQLVEYFGSEEGVADAFAVSLQTVRAWGPLVPPAHFFRAEVLTNGYVQSPR